MRRGFARAAAPAQGKPVEVCSMLRSLLAITFVCAPLLAGCYGPPPGPGTGDPGDDETEAPDAGPAAGPDAAAQNPYDATVFKTVVQPMLDDYGCTSANCHAAGLGGFKVVADATGADLDANFTEVTKRNDLDTPTESRVYARGTVSHIGSQVFAEADAQKFLDWVTAAAP
jgi:hypothetical protein